MGSTQQKEGTAKTHRTESRAHTPWEKLPEGEGAAVAPSPSQKENRKAPRAPGLPRFLL